MIPALSLVNSLSAPLETQLEDYAAGKCQAVELWLTKIEEYLKAHSVPQFLELLQRHELLAPVASFQGGILESQGERRKVAWELFQQRLELCRQLGAKTLVVACDIPAPLSQTTIDRVQVSLKQAAQQAEQSGIRLALEFQANAAFGNNLQTAVALVAEVGSPALGICLDAYHWYVGPSKLDDLALLSTENLFHVQFSDLADVPRELATDSQRILPGDGDIRLDAMVTQFRQIGYCGLVAVEILNPQLWQIPTLQFGEIAMTALRKVLGEAS